jgi:membrane protein implicated in regulation of membrane protease activity
MRMAGLFWCCFAGGVLFALATILFGDLFQTDHLHFIQPVVAVGGITVFGAAGILLERYSGWPAPAILAAALLAAVIVSLLLYFLYVKRMKEAENSVGFSMQELGGRIGEVLTAVPEHGYGEVLVKIGAGVTNQIAASFDGESLPTGTRVVVVEVRDGTLYVSRLNDKNEGMDGDA